MSGIGHLKDSTTLGNAVAAVLPSMQWRVVWEDGSSEQVIAWLCQSDGSFHAVVNDQGRPVLLSAASQPGRLAHPSSRSEPAAEASANSNDRLEEIYNLLPSNSEPGVTLQAIGREMDLVWDKSNRDWLAAQMARLEHEKRIERLLRGAGQPALHRKL